MCYNYFYYILLISKCYKYLEYVALLINSEVIQNKKIGNIVLLPWSFKEHFSLHTILNNILIWLKVRCLVMAKINQKTKAKKELLIKILINVKHVK
jgi:hypothetical protein